MHTYKQNLFFKINKSISGEMLNCLKVLCKKITQINYLPNKPNFVGECSFVSNNKPDFVGEISFVSIKKQIPSLTYESYSSNIFFITEQILHSRGSYVWVFLFIYMKFYSNKEFHTRPLPQPDTHKDISTDILQ